MEEEKAAAMTTTQTTTTQQPPPQPLEVVLQHPQLHKSVQEFQSFLNAAKEDLTRKSANLKNLRKRIPPKHGAIKSYLNCQVFMLAKHHHRLDSFEGEICSRLQALTKKSSPESATDVVGDEAPDVDERSNAAALNRDVVQLLGDMDKMKRRCKHMLDVTDRFCVISSDDLRLKNIQINKEKTAATDEGEQEEQAEAAGNSSTSSGEGNDEDGSMSPAESGSYSACAKIDVVDEDGPEELPKGDVNVSDDSKTAQHIIKVEVVLEDDEEDETDGVFADDNAADNPFEPHGDEDGPIDIRGGSNLLTTGQFASSSFAKGRCVSLAETSDSPTPPFPEVGVQGDFPMMPRAMSDSDILLCVTPCPSSPKARKSVTPTPIVTKSTISISKSPLPNQITQNILRSTFESFGCHLAVIAKSYTSKKAHLSSLSSPTA